MAGLLNATVTGIGNDAAGVVGEVVASPVGVVGAVVANATAVAIANLTHVEFEKEPSLMGHEMVVARGALQKLTDPLDLQEPWTAILYIIGDIYMFCALHIIVHTRFSIAMERIVELSGMNEDVAGATLMAIGTSLPEVLSGAVGVFVPGAGDTGLGCVVGSLVFNMLVITGCCVVVFPRELLELSRAATVRDVSFQVLVVGMLIWAFHNKQADVSNVFCFLLMYIVYILLCANSSHMEACRAMDEVPFESTEDFGSEEELGKATELQAVLAETQSCPHGHHGHNDGHHARESLSRHCPPPTNPKDLVIWILTTPLMVIEFLIVFTIPDVDSPTWNKKRHLKPGLALNVLMSTLWIGVFVLLMIQWAIKAGELLGISPATMGLTFCAAGTSLPDCMCSIIVARQGKGNMAISNVFGSNVFDILIAMGVPWALHYLINGTHNKIKMEAEGFGAAIVILAMVMILYLVCVILFRFKLPKTVGYIHLAAYVAFLAYAFAHNMHVFKEVFGHKRHFEVS